mmetsp:Transcript_14443/g.23546  ORF Transcript_14443/g.23546 Transcript_14443/m.23546 type:complete len:221 (-) Transcript_14443:223-885(-)
MSNNWRDTLFVWDGILSSDEEETKEGEEDEGSINIRLKWEGTWVGCESVDAAAVETPKRGAFERDVTSAYSFATSGTASNKDPATNFYHVSMSGSYELGEGEDKKKHTDDVHDMYLSLLRWTGNLRGQADNLVVALGSNEFGKFISVGYLRVGNRITLARRYLDDGDLRCKWNVDALKSAVLEEIASAGKAGMTIPPWQCAAMHAEAEQPSAKRQKQDPQ